MISVPLFVLVKGTETYRAEIEGVRLPSADPLKLEVAVANQGNVHLRASGICVLRDTISGEEVLRVPLNVYHFPLYPGVTNTLIANDSRSIAPGDYTCSVELPFPDNQHLVSASFDLHVPGGEK